MPRQLLMMLISAATLFSLTATSTAAPFTVDGSTVYVNAGFVGIRTSTPTAVLDVNGDAQFGSGATKSTFTLTGNLTLASAASITGSSATFTASGSNIYSLTTSSGIHILAGGITWADNTTSTTATAGSSGSGTDKVVQFVTSMTTAVITTTSQIPDDNTIPQNTEGVQVLLATITPQSSTNKLLIQAVTNINNTAAGFSAISALFQDSGANAIAAAMQNEGGAYRIQNVTLYYVMDAGTTSATTFKLRIGASNTNNTTLNGDPSTGYLGGALKATLTITEFKP